MFKTIGNFLDDPIQTTVDLVTQPLSTTLKVIDGLSEGELRQKAIMSLGAEAVTGMSTDELTNWYKSL